MLDGSDCMKSNWLTEGDDGKKDDGEMRCLYRAIPSMPMDMFVMHMRNGKIELKGGKVSCFHSIISKTIIYNIHGCQGI